MNVKDKIKALNKKEQEKKDNPLNLDNIDFRQKSKSIYIPGNRKPKNPENAEMKNNSNLNVPEINIKEKKSNKKVQYVETTEKIRNKVAIFEDSVRKNAREKEEKERQQRLYEQNRANIRERMRKLKQFIREKKDLSKTNEEFFEEYKQFFFDEYQVKTFAELQKFIANYDKENPDELEKEELERYKKSLVIEHLSNNEVKIFPEIKRFDNVASNKENNLHINNSKNYFKILTECTNTNEINFIPNIKKYINNKSKTYSIKSLDNDRIKGIKKIKYDNKTELIESPNIISFTYEKTPKQLVLQGENFYKSGIPLEEVRNRKIIKMLGNLSDEDKDNYQKVEAIIRDIKNKDNDKEIFDNIFCINCNECCKKDEEGNHLGHTLIQIDKSTAIDKDENDLDYNASLNKLYQNLKDDQNKILKAGKYKLISYYGRILFYLYEIIINNNCIEEINISLININDDYNKEVDSGTFNQYFKNYFLFYVITITKLAYFKETKIEKLLADLEDENNDLENMFNKNDENENLSNIGKSYNNKENSDDNFEDILSQKMGENIDKINFNYDNFNEENKKKYFLKLGLELKYKYMKNESITDLYYKAKEENIDPFNYEDFIIKNLNIPSIH